jgi:hypothetical protein
MIKAFVNPDLIEDDVYWKELIKWHDFIIAKMEMI